MTPFLGSGALLSRSLIGYIGIQRSRVIFQRSGIGMQQARFLTTGENDETSKISKLVTSGMKIANSSHLGLAYAAIQTVSEITEKGVKKSESDGIVDVLLNTVDQLAEHTEETDKLGKTKETAVKIGGKIKDAQLLESLGTASNSAIAYANEMPNAMGAQFNDFKKKFLTGNVEETAVEALPQTDSANEAAPRVNSNLTDHMKNLWNKPWSPWSKF